VIQSARLGLPATMISSVDEYRAHCFFKCHRVRMRDDPKSKN
jgi:hypothetical protein